MLVAAFVFVLLLIALVPRAVPVLAMGGVAGLIGWMCLNVPTGAV